jgi:hypothetical protein
MARRIEAEVLAAVDLLFFPVLEHHAARRQYSIYDGTLVQRFIKVKEKDSDTFRPDH